MADSTVRFDERAERDAEAAVEWYDGQRAGLGTEFLEALDETVASISQHPRMYPEVEANIRRALTNRFPYSVYYRSGEEDEWVDIAILSRCRPRLVVRIRRSPRADALRNRRGRPV